MARGAVISMAVGVCQIFNDSRGSVISVAGVEDFEYFSGVFRA